MTMGREGGRERERERDRDRTGTTTTATHCKMKFQGRAHDKLVPLSVEDPSACRAALVVFACTYACMYICVRVCGTEACVHMFMSTKISSIHTNILDTAARC